MRLVRRIFLPLVPPAIAVAVSIALLAIGLALAKYPALSLLREWFTAAVADRFNIEVALKNSCPLLLTGLAAGVAFRAGVLNIGAEGQSILGAIAAAAVATRMLPGLHASAAAITVALAAAVVAGALFAGVAAGLELLRGVPVVLSTILLNFVALQLLDVLLEGPLKSHLTQAVQSDPMPAAFQLPLIGGSLVVHAGVVIAAVAALIAWGVQSRTTLGFELLVTGLNPAAARYSGIPTASRQGFVLLFSGGFAGLSGAIQTLGVGGHVLTQTPESYGYTGIAVALLGRLHPVGIAAAALFFALLDQGAATLETSATPLPHETADILKGLITLALLTSASLLANRRVLASETAMEVTTKPDAAAEGRAA
ncbi:MAG TPA: ABC transporter permease [Phycisphaerae bacterium]|nr:ABC transporter permease [Phycisphaerae bacterium]